MILALLPWLADALALLGLVVLTISVYGILRTRDVATRLHARGGTRDRSRQVSQRAPEGGVRGARRQ